MNTFWWKTKISRIAILFIIGMTAVSGCQPVSENISPGGLGISEAHPFFWSYNGEPVLLLGGSVEDNLFQVENVVSELELLKSVGGNYVRNTMSSRDSGNVWPFRRLDNGKYDLDQWDETYWQRFDSFLQEAEKRDIIVQVEVWATFDFYREEWGKNPYNPDNCINYFSQEWTRLESEVPTHPIFTRNNFFRSTPRQMNLEKVLYYQGRYVDKLLSYALKYNNVLYCIDNETSVSALWGEYWAGYIHKEAQVVGKQVYVTEMWNAREMSNPVHKITSDNPELFSFIDISQNNHIEGEKHWQGGLAQVERLKKLGYQRPVNNVKVYGNDGGQHKTTRDAIESFCKNVLMGCASTRFHRPNSGQGLNKTAQAVIKSLREVTDLYNHFDARPANDLLTRREPDEAYCRAIPGEAYMLYFPKHGKVGLDLSGYKGNWHIKWMDVLSNEWIESSSVDGGENLTIETPGERHYLLLVSKKE